jgi:hypothetical protein
MGDEQRRRVDDARRGTEGAVLAPVTSRSTPQAVSPSGNPPIVVMQAT